MKSLKTYEDINVEEKSMRFAISRMEAIYTKRNGKVDEPHRHNYFTVLIIEKAKGLHKIDFNTYDLGQKQVFFVGPGQVHQVIEKQKPEGFAMTFSAEFLIENNISLSFIESLNLFQNYGHNPALSPNEEQFKAIKHFSNQIFEIFESTANMKFLSIGAYLKLLLIACNNVCAMNPIASNTERWGDNLIRSFKKEVEKNYTKEHSTRFYANALHITADHLNRTVKAKIGKTAKDYIQTRIVTEAKRLLCFTALNNKEIGYTLGFNEPANFSAFFKKHTQLSPSNFKKTEVLK